MRELGASEIKLTAGGVKPIDNPESELGKRINDAAELCEKIGAWLGSAIYDLTH